MKTLIGWGRALIYYVAVVAGICITFISAAYVSEALSNFMFGTAEYTSPICYILLFSGITVFVLFDEYKRRQRIKLDAERYKS